MQISLLVMLFPSKTILKESKTRSRTKCLMLLKSYYHPHEYGHYNLYTSSSLTHICSNTKTYFKTAKKMCMCACVSKDIYVLSVPPSPCPQPSKQRWRRLPYIRACDFLHCRPFPLCSVYAYTHESAHILISFSQPPGMMPAFSQLVHSIHRAVLELTWKEGITG